MNVIVTGGGTRAPIDDVRAVTNTSTGRFSARITEALLERGATVWHVHTPGALLPYARSAALDLDGEFDAEVERLRALHRRHRLYRPRLRLWPVEGGTVADYAATLHRLLTTRSIDAAVLAMAVSDFEPTPEPGKLDSGRDELVLRCRPTAKIIRMVKDWSPDVFLVGFKLLSDVPEAELLRRARESLVANRADLVVANDLRTVAADRHAVHLVRPDGGHETLGPGDSLAGDLADRLLDAVNLHVAARPPIPLDAPGD
jgi:phosphopantothenate-cysteine ligase